MSLLQVVPELALVVGKGLKKRTGSAVQGVRLVLNAARGRNCRDSKQGSRDFELSISFKRGQKH